MRIVRIAHVALLLALVGAGGCSGKGDEAPAPAKSDAAATKAAPGGHAPAGAKPGSHEDWCEEHAVPESQCTQCDPSLIAAFKATGDWCPEHGLPESQCTKCDPARKIERPAKKP